MLRVRFRFIRRRRRLFSIFPGHTALVGIIRLATFSRTIKRRASPMNDRLSALQAMPRLAGLCPRFHDEHLACRGVPHRNMAMALERRGWHLRGVCGNTVKIDSTKNITANWRWWPAPLLIVTLNMPQSGLKAIRRAQKRCRKHNKKRYRR